MWRDGREGVGLVEVQNVPIMRSELSSITDDSVAYWVATKDPEGRGKVRWPVYGSANFVSIQGGREVLTDSGSSFTTWA